MDTEKLESFRVEEAVRTIIRLAGEDPDREGLRETPRRVVKAYREYLFSGYGKDPKDILKVFRDGGSNYDQMIVVKDIPFFSLCEHHMLPFFGKATIAYVPNSKGEIVGLSKLSRLLDIYARRLQVQERLTRQVAEAIETYLDPAGCGVFLSARHFCMECRGISKQGHKTITNALTGIFREERAQAEFMSHCYGV